MSGVQFPLLTEVALANLLVVKYQMVDFGILFGRVRTEF